MTRSTKFSWRLVTCGAPQGCTSVLCNSLINDLDDGAECILNKFANTIEMGGMTDTPDGCAAVQRNLSKLEEGASKNLMKVTKGNAKSCTWRGTIP